MACAQNHGHPGRTGAGSFLHSNACTISWALHSVPWTSPDDHSLHGLSFHAGRHRMMLYMIWLSLISAWSWGSERPSAGLGARSQHSIGHASFVRTALSAGVSASLRGSSRSCSSRSSARPFLPRLGRICLTSATYIVPLYFLWHWNSFISRAGRVRSFIAANSDADESCAGLANVAVLFDIRRYYLPYLQVLCIYSPSCLSLGVYAFALFGCGQLFYPG